MHRTFAYTSGEDLSFVPILSDEERRKRGVFVPSVPEQKVDPQTRKRQKCFDEQSIRLERSLKYSAAQMEVRRAKQDWHRDKLVSALKRDAFLSSRNQLPTGDRTQFIDWKTPVPVCGMPTATLLQQVVENPYEPWFFRSCAIQLQIRMPVRVVQLQPLELEDPSQPFTLQNLIESVCLAFMEIAKEPGTLLVDVKSIYMTGLGMVPVPVQPGSAACIWRCVPVVFWKP